MTKWIPVAVLFALSGCFSPDTLAHQEPTTAFNTTEMVASIRDCITEKHPSVYVVTPHQDGWLILNGDNVVPNFSVQLDPAPGGTHVEVRVAKALGHFYLKEAMACLDNLPRV